MRSEAGLFCPTTAKAQVCRTATQVTNRIPQRERNPGRRAGLWDPSSPRGQGGLPAPTASQCGYGSSSSSPRPTAVSSLEVSCRAAPSRAWVIARDLPSELELFTHAHAPAPACGPFPSPAASAGTSSWGWERSGVAGSVPARGLGPEGLPPRRQGELSRGPPRRGRPWGPHGERGGTESDREKAWLCVSRHTPTRVHRTALRTCRCLPIRSPFWRHKPPPWRASVPPALLPLLREPGGGTGVSLFSHRGTPNVKAAALRIHGCFRFGALNTQCQGLPGAHAQQKASPGVHLPL